MTTSINTILKNRKKNKKKGFSLVELIVVLVIMAILAAALVPTLIGYINQTRQSNSKNEAAQCVQAAQTVLSSAYADPSGTYVNNSDKTKNVTFTAWTLAATETAPANMIDVVTALAEVKGTVSNIAYTKGVIVGLEYTAPNGDVVTYADGTYTVGSGAAPVTTAKTPGLA